MSAHASTLDPTCLRCMAPMALTLSGCPLLPRRFLAECPACGRTVAVTLTARPLRAGRAHSPPELAGAPPPMLKKREALALTDASPLPSQFSKSSKLGGHMKCGDRGHRTASGKPCQQNIASTAKGCLWHTRNAEQRHVLAVAGGIASRRRHVLPVDYHMIPFESRECVIRFAEDLARRVLTSDLDARRVDSALRAASVALSAFAQATQEKLVEALLKLENGGSALILLERLQVGLTEGRRRPLPVSGLLAHQSVPRGEPS